METKQTCNHGWTHEQLNQILATELSKLAECKADTSHPFRAGMVKGAELRVAAVKGHLAEGN